MTAILEIPQYVAYQKNVVYALFTLSTKSHTFNKYRTIMLSCPTKLCRRTYKKTKRCLPHTKVIHVGAYKRLVLMKSGLDFSAGPPVPTGKIPGGPAMFVLNPSVGPVEFYPSIYNSDPTNLKSFLILQKL